MSFKRKFLTSLITATVSIPIWSFILWIIIIPKDYVSDGGSDFGYGLFILLALICAVTITSIFAWVNADFINKTIKKKKNNER